MRYIASNIRSMPRINATIPENLKGDIKTLAKEDSRSFSEMVSLLLQQAVKDRTRRRKSVKEGNS